MLLNTISSDCVLHTVCFNCVAVCVNIFSHDLLRLLSFGGFRPGKTYLAVDSKEVQVFVPLISTIFYLFFTRVGPGLEHLFGFTEATRGRHSLERTRGRGNGPRLYAAPHKGTHGLVLSLGAVEADRFAITRRLVIPIKGSAAFRAFHY